MAVCQVLTSFATVCLSLVMPTLHIFISCRNGVDSPIQGNMSRDNSYLIVLVCFADFKQLPERLLAIRNLGLRWKYGNVQRLHLPFDEVI